MRRLVTAIGLLASFVLLVQGAPAARAEAPMREFRGKVDKISKTEMIADDRRGTKVKFVKLDDTVVEGEKKDWKSVKKNDWVVVHWKMIDKPRKAYKVVVLPPQQEAGEELE
jgi:hypothetical protein